MPDRPKPPRAYRTQAPPKCQIHGVLMVVANNLPTVRYYRCPVDKCGQRAKQARHDKIIP